MCSDQTHLLKVHKYPDPLQSIYTSLRMFSGIVRKCIEPDTSFTSREQFLKEDSNRERSWNNLIWFQFSLNIILKIGKKPHNETIGD